MKEVVYKNLKSTTTESTSHQIGSKRVLLKGYECESMLTQAAIGSLLKGEFVDSHSHQPWKSIIFSQKGKQNLLLRIVNISVKKTPLLKSLKIQSIR